MSEMTMASLKARVGTELGVSKWLLVDQQRIQNFAECTEDRQWIHVDVERAQRESPLRGTIAHGYLALSLVAALSMDVGIVPADASAALNYGLDKVRFLTPVPAGARVRLRVAIDSVDEKEGGQLIVKTINTLEVENAAKPALVAEALALIVPAKLPT